ncbi:MAG: hypothetical protein AB7L13_18315 [Acidimicrobiia bacterium]
MRIVIADPGGDESRSAAAARRWREHGDVAHIEVDEMPAVRVDPRSPMSARRVQAMVAHWSAWEFVAEGDEPALIVDIDAEPAVPPEELADNVAGLDGIDQPVVVGDELSAYYVTADGAATLLAVSPLDRLPALPLALERAGAAMIESPLVVAIEGPDASPYVADHIHVVEWAALSSLSSASLEPDDLVIAVDPAEAQMVGDPVDVAVAMATAEAEAVVAPGVVVGFAGALAAPVAAPASVVADVSSPTIVAINGRVTDAITGFRPPLLSGPLVARRRLLADERGSDLARILRYDDAQAPLGALRELGAEIVTTPFLRPDFCAALIRGAEAAEAWGFDPDDPVPGRELSLSTISPRLFAHLKTDLSTRLFPLLRTRWPYIDDAGLRDAFVIKYVPGASERLRMHHDVAQLSGSIRLNDGYIGGELAFPRHGVDNSSLAVGDVVVWPSLVTHPHAALPVVSGVKYNLTIWWEIPS